MGEFRYLGYIIPVMVVEVLITVFVVHKLAPSCYCSCWKAVEESTGDLTSVEEPMAVQNMSFQNVYKSCVSPNSRSATICLLIYRACCFGYFFGVGVIWNLIRSDGWQYFTNWNLILISVFYFLASISTIIGLLYGGRDTEWSRTVRRLGYCVHVFFEVAGGTALLVTTVDFGLLNPEFSYWNATQHFATLLSLVLELCMNSLPIRLDHYGFNALWASLYLIFIWPVVATHARRHWPYSFLDTSTAACFVWYTGLLMVDVLFFCVWVLLGRLKVLVLLRLRRGYGEDLAHTKDAYTDNALLAEMKTGVSAC